MKKFMMIATILVVGLMFMPNVLAYKGGYGNVEDVTQDDSKIEGTSPEITKGTTEKTDDTTIVKYSGYDLKVLEAKEDATAGKRPAGYAWVGIKVAYPDEEVNQDSYDVYFNGEKYPEGEGEKNADNFTDYFGVKDTNLKNAIQNGTLLEYTLGFDWDKNGDIDQYVLIQVDPMTVQLYEDDEMQEPVWTTEMAEEEQEKVEASKTPIEPSEQEEPAEEATKDESNPDTSDINLYMLFGLIAASGCGIAYTIKKRFN